MKINCFIGKKENFGHWIIFFINENGEITSMRIKKKEMKRLSDFGIPFEVKKND